MAAGQVRRVLVITLVFNLTVAVGKIGVGLASGALAITADGFHSLIDSVSNVMALIASLLASRPPDDDHPYGHQRFETLAALLIGMFLILVAWEIAGGALERLVSGGTPLNLTPLTFGVMLATLAVNIGVSTYQIRQGRRLHSELLLADAANTRADVYVTLSVLFSMVVVSSLGWLWVDVVAALIVVALIGHAAWRILTQTSAVLVDRAPYSPQQLADLVASTPYVKSVVRARSRGTEDAPHIDIDVRVAPEITARHSAAIADSIRQRLCSALGEVDEVEVHFLPDESAGVDYALAVRSIADGMGLATHEVQRIGDTLELHVEVPPTETLETAHIRVTRLESRLRSQLPEINEVITHIEPVAPIDYRSAESRSVIQRVLTLLQDRFPAVDWHHVRVSRCQSGLSLSLHAALDGDVSLEYAHNLTEDAEVLLRANLDDLNRVTIHTEPDHQQSA